VGGLGADGSDPLLYGLGHELRPIVGPDMAWHATQDEDIGQHVDHIDGLELAGASDRQAFMGKLIDDIEHSVLPSIVGAILDEVVRPDVVAMLRPQPAALPIRQPKPAAFRLFVGNLQPPALPDPFDPFVIDDPASLLQ
jgi:hypothetical protein